LNVQLFAEMMVADTPRVWTPANAAPETESAPAATTAMPNFRVAWFMVRSTVTGQALGVPGTLMGPGRVTSI